MYRQSKAELEDLRQEHQREMEGLLENVRNLSRDLRLQMLIIESFVPDEFQVGDVIHSLLPFDELHSNASRFVLAVAEENRR